MTSTEADADDRGIRERKAAFGLCATEAACPLPPTKLPSAFDGKARVSVVALQTLIRLDFRQFYCARRKPGMSCC
jgi:hypothetical protein